LLSCQALDRDLDDGCASHHLRGKREGPFRVLGHDERQGLLLFYGILDQTCPTGPDYALVADAPITASVGLNYALDDVELETHFVVLPQNVQFPTLPCTMEVQRLAIVAETERDDVRSPLARQAKAADLTAPDDRIDLRSIPDLLFGSPHRFPFRQRDCRKTIFQVISFPQNGLSREQNYSREKLMLSTFKKSRCTKYSYSDSRGQISPLIPYHAVDIA